MIQRRELIGTRPAGPRYGSRSVAEILPSFLAAVTGGEEDALGLGPRRRLVILVVDGLGDEQLAANADVAPFLFSQRGEPIDAAFPTTTVVSLASIALGFAPGRHGIVGTTSALPDEPRALDLLHWCLGTWPNAEGAKQLVPPELHQPHAGVLARMNRDGIATTAVLRPEFVGSGLTRAILRDAHTTVAASSLRDSLEAARHAIDEAGARPALVYVHDGEVDLRGHLFGPATPEWREALAQVDREIAAFAGELPHDVTLAVTADHGMVAVTHLVEAGDDERLTVGVRVWAGEPRFRQAHVVAGAAADVMAAWAEVLEPAFDVLSRDEAIDLGWFGPVDEAIRDRIGDVLALARQPHVALVHRDLDPFGGRLRGMHGALTSAELLVPWIVIDGGSAWGTSSSGELRRAQ